MQTPKTPLKTLVNETDLLDIVVGDQVEWGYDQAITGSGQVVGISQNVINTLHQFKSKEALVIQQPDGQIVTLPQRRLPTPYTWRGYFLRKVAV